MKKTLSLLPWLISFPFALVFLNNVIDDVPINWEELALGKETFSPHTFLENGLRVYAKYNDSVIHCEALESCSSNSFTKIGNEKILWLGNSQLHAINQYESKQRLSSEYLFEKLQKNKYDLLTVSFPSANLQEHLVTYNSILLDTNLSRLILGIVFDDFREDGVRFEIASNLNNTLLRNSLSNSLIGNQILKDSQSITDIEDEYSGLSDTLQERSEKKINNFLEESTYLWERRPYLRGYFFNLGYKVRNYIFNINPSTKRKMIPPRYKKNWDALEQILKLSSEKNISVLVYVALLGMMYPSHMMLMSIGCLKIIFLI